MLLDLVRRVKVPEKMSENENVDHKTVAGFGDEWSRVDK